MLAYALMEGVGLTVVPVLLTDSSRQRFSPEIPDRGQFLYGARVVLRVEDVSGRIFVDPACRYCRPASRTGAIPAAEPAASCSTTTPIRCR